MSPPSPAASAAAARRLSTPPSLRGHRSSPSSSGGVSKKRRSLLTSLQPPQQQHQVFVQMNLDFGQSKLGMVSCPGCGMVYSAGNESDAVRHARFHSSTAPSPKSASWRGQQAVKEFFNGDRIVRVSPTDKAGWQRARDIFELMDMELGKGTQPEAYVGMLVLLYVKHQVGIVGCCIAEPIRTAYRVLPPPAVSASGESPAPAPAEDSLPPPPLQRSSEPQVAKCGIHKVWCRSGHRRSGIATAMLEAARANLCLGLQVPLHLVAFTSPTPSGYRLACRYLGTSEPLVY